MVIFQVWDGGLAVEHGGWESAMRDICEMGRLVANCSRELCLSGRSRIMNYARITPGRKFLGADRAAAWKGGVLA